MEKLRLFLKGESISDSTERSFSNMVIDKIESGAAIYITINIIKVIDQAAADTKNPIIARLTGIRRVLQDAGATKPKVVIEVGLSSNGYIRLVKAIGNGYLITGYSSELGMKVSKLSNNDVAYLDYNQTSNSAIKNMEDNVIQEQNKERESKLKYTGYNNQGFVLSLEKCNLKMTVDKLDLEQIINASKSDNTSLKFDVLITGKNKRARPLRIVLDSQHAYYQGVAIGTYNIMGGFLNGYLDIALDNNDNTHLLFTAIQMRCEVNPCNYNSRRIPFDIPNSRILFKDSNGNMALFKSTKISIVSRKKDKLTEMSKGYKKDALHTICSEDRKDANKETENEESASIHLVVDTTHYFHHDNNSTLESSLSSIMEYLRANIRINNMYIDKAKISGVYALKTSTYPGASILVRIKLTIGEYNKVMQYLNNSFIISGFLLNVKNRTEVVGSLRSLEFGESADSNIRFKFPETNENPVFTDIKPTIIKRIPYGKGIEIYNSLLKGLVTFPENYEFTFNHKIDKEVTGLIKDIEFDKDANTTFLEVSFANDVIASKATKLFIEGKMKENTYYILPVLGSKTPSNIRTKLKSRVSESTEDILNRYLEKSFIENKAKKEMIETIINSFSHIENNDSAFNLKRHILTTLRKDPKLSPLTRVFLNKAIVALQGSSIQENIPGEIELKVSAPIMSLKHHTLINNNRKENYLAIIEIMDASFKCPITDLSVCKNIDGSIEKIMTTVSVSAKALKAIKMYGLSFRDKAGIVIGRLIERNTGNYVAHISIPSQEDLLHYRNCFYNAWLVNSKPKEAVEYNTEKMNNKGNFDGDDGDTVTYKFSDKFGSKVNTCFLKDSEFPESNLRNPVLPEDLNPENKTFKHVSEITDKYLSRLLNVSISRGITKNGLESIITTIPIAKFSKREYLDSFVQKYSSQYKFNKMFSDKNEAGLSYRNNKDFEMYIIDDKAGYPQLDIEHENNIFTASSRVYIPIGLLIKLGAKTFKELYNKVTDDCELDVDFNVDTRSADPEPISTQSKDSESEYKSILYPEVKFERLKDAKKYADAINEGIRDTLKSSNEISNLPILTIDDFKDFRAYIEKATVGTSHHEGFKDNIAYSAVLCIYVPNEVIKKLKEDNISLEDIIGYALENIQICKKGKLKNITMATPGFPIGVYFNKINQHLGNNNSIWTQKDGDTVKTYRVLYTYVKNAKIKALAIEKE